ncbi:PREDICTED: protein SPT2 homolog [Priapulus caudatus]|uniref:Protein SPT2 homolog n=1 Tax=Priapulus caudatus TaxID=37621 RepID=A0ABM1DWC3_PRICU|nr:PREDICTED: protein SPT2 homolog [Priapulus caudatus]
MDLEQLLKVAEKNNGRKSHNSKDVKYFNSKVPPPKKDPKSKVQPNAIKAFMARKEEEERKKETLAHQKKEELLAARQVAGTARKARSMATRTKDNLKDNSNLTLGKRETQNYEDARRKFQDKVDRLKNERLNLIETEVKGGIQPSAVSTKRERNEDSSCRSSDKKSRSNKKECAPPSKTSSSHKRKPEGASGKSRSSANGDAERHESLAPKREIKRARAPPPPAMDFADLLRLAEQKQKQPVMEMPTHIEVEVERRSPERLLTKREKEKMQASADRKRKSHQPASQPDAKQPRQESSSRISERKRSGQEKPSSKLEVRRPAEKSRPKETVRERGNQNNSVSEQRLSPGRTKNEKRTNSTSSKPHRDKHKRDSHRQEERENISYSKSDQHGSSHSGDSKRRIPSSSQNGKVASGSGGKPLEFDINAILAEKRKLEEENRRLKAEMEQSKCSSRGSGDKHVVSTTARDDVHRHHTSGSRDSVQDRLSGKTPSRDINSASGKGRPAELSRPAKKSAGRDINAVRAPSKSSAQPSPAKRVATETTHHRSSRPDASKSSSGGRQSKHASAPASSQHDKQSKSKHDRSASASHRGSLAVTTKDRSSPVKSKPARSKHRGRAASPAPVGDIDSMKRQLPLPPIGEKYRRELPPIGAYYRSGAAYDDDEEEEDSDMDGFVVDEDEEDEEGGDYSKYIKEIFGYDKNKYKYEDDDEIMESSYSQMMKEEARSERLAAIEDIDDMKMEEQMKQAKQLRLKKQRK